MNFKIGKFTYHEISEEMWEKLSDNKVTDIAVLTDYDGDPIKFFKIIRKKEKKEKK